MILLFTTTLGLWIIFKTILDTRKGKASQHWQTTQGKVTHAGVMNWRSWYRGFSSSSEISYFQYEYTVEGQKIFGARIFFGDFLLSGLGISKDLKQIIQTYAPEQPVTVYYNPAKPAESVLQPGIRSVVRWGYFIGIGIIIAGFIYAFIVGAQQAELYAASLFFLL